MMSINRKNKLILSFVCAVMIFNIDVIHCCSTTPNATNANTMDSNRETACSAHNDCPTDLPFCYMGNCDVCEQCEYCHDGIDGTCGTCGADFPTNEKGSCKDDEGTSTLPRSERTSSNTGTIAERTSTRNRPETTPSTTTTPTTMTTTSKITNATDTANVKVIACNNAQTLSTADKQTLSNNDFTKCAEPFGILVAGSKGMTDFTILDTARILAEMLDQNRDGVVDDPKVHAQLNCTAWMTVHTSDISFQLTGRQAYFEVDKFWHSNGSPVYTEGKETRAVRVEEVHHAITQVGYGKAYPQIFSTDGGWSVSSTLVNECKKARCDWWQHPENNCTSKTPTLPRLSCMKTWASQPGVQYPGNGGSACTTSEAKSTCNYPSCDCIEWYHQIALLYAGQTPGWISETRKEAGLTGNKVMPRNKNDMIAMLTNKNKPILDVLKNTEYNKIQAPLKYDYPVLTGTAPKLSICNGNGNDGNGGRG